MRHPPIEPSLLFDDGVGKLLGALRLQELPWGKEDTSLFRGVGHPKLIIFPLVFRVKPSFQHRARALVDARMG